LIQHAIVVGVDSFEQIFKVVEENNVIMFLERLEKGLVLTGETKFVSAQSMK